MHAEKEAAGEWACLRDDGMEDLHYLRGKLAQCDTESSRNAGNVARFSELHVNNACDCSLSLPVAVPFARGGKIETQKRGGGGGGDTEDGSINGFIGKLETGIRS